MLVKTSKQSRILDIVELLIQDFDSEFEEGYKLVKASKNATIRTIRL